MPMFPDYIIKSNDTRFEATWDAWSYKLLEALHYSPTTINYTTQMELVLRANYTAPPKLTITRDIITAANYCRANNYCDTYMIAYDGSFCDYVTLNHILIDYSRVKRRNDFQVGVSTAFGLTAKLNEELLDEPIPDVNIVTIIYTRG